MIDTVRRVRRDRRPHHVTEMVGDAVGITVMRLGVSSAVLVAVLRPRPWRWSRDAQVATLLFGLAMAGMNIVFYLALRTLPLGVAVTVEFPGPLMG